MLELHVVTMHQNLVEALNSAKIEGIHAEHRPTIAYDTFEEHILEIVIVAASAEAVRFFKDWLVGFFKREQTKELIIEHQIINNAEHIEVVINNYIGIQNERKKH